MLPGSICEGEKGSLRVGAAWAVMQDDIPQGVAPSPTNRQLGVASMPLAAASVVDKSPRLIWPPVSYDMKVYAKTIWHFSFS